MHISNEYPFLDVRITVRAFRTSYRALVDTGFDGHLTLPVSFVANLAVADSHAQWTLAEVEKMVFTAEAQSTQSGFLDAAPSELSASRR